MKNLLLLTLPIILLACCSTSKQGPDVRPTVTSKMLVGSKYGYAQPAGPMTYYHWVEFMTDTQAGILLGGDVVEIAKYDIHFDTIMLRIDHFDPIYTKNLIYTDSGLVDTKGTLWKRLQ